MSRRKSRILAFQALFSWEASESTLEDLLTFSWLQKDSTGELETSPVLESDAAKDEKLFASLLVSLLARHVAGDMCARQQQSSALLQVVCQRMAQVRGHAVERGVLA